MQAHKSARYWLYHLICKPFEGRVVAHDALDPFATGTVLT